MQIQDAAGNVAEATTTISQPEALTIKTDILAPASTGNSDGSAIAEVTGGTGVYSYTWDNGETASKAVALAPGERGVTVTDENGCTITATLEITENILPLAVSIDVTQPVLCAGSEGGAVSAEASGGKAPFTFNWSNSASGQSLTSLAPGTYDVSVTDASGQTATTSVQLVAPEPLVVAVDNLRAAAAEHVPDGKATAVVSGGVAPYTIAWDSGESDARATKLSIGTHTLIVTDANSCSAQTTFEISKKIIPALTAETLESGEAVRMERLQFDADSSNVNQASIPTLNELYDFLYDNPTIVVEIGGHTNGLPEHAYCDSLSTERAKSAAQYIVQKGIDAKRVYYKGYGKRKPIATNRTPEGRKKNQRVEVRILRLSDEENE